MKCQGGRVWGNHGMDWYPVKGGIVVILLVASFEEARIIGSGPGLVDLYALSHVYVE